MDCAGYRVWPGARKHPCAGLRGKDYTQGATGYHGMMSRMASRRTSQ